MFAKEWNTPAEHIDFELELHISRSERMSNPLDEEPADFHFI